MTRPECQPVNSSYGAPLGRHAHPAPFFGRVRARRVRLDSGGYDQGGAYWGHGAPLYYVYGAEDGAAFVRARSNAAAIEAAIATNGDDNPPRPGPWRRNGHVWYGQCGDLPLTIERVFPGGMYRWSFVASHYTSGAADTLAVAKARAIAASRKES